MSDKGKPMKAVIEIELEIAGEYDKKIHDEMITDAILLSLDSMWFVDEDNNDGIDVISKSATCKLVGKP